MQAKLDQKLNTCNECLKWGKYDPLKELFNIAKENGEWLSSEDRRLYHLQIESKVWLDIKIETPQIAKLFKRRKVTLERTSTVSVTSTSESEIEYQESEKSEEKSARKG